MSSTKKENGINNKSTPLRRRKKSLTELDLQKNQENGNKEEEKINKNLNKEDKNNTETIISPPKSRLQTMITRVIAGALMISFFVFVLRQPRYIINFY